MRLLPGKHINPAVSFGLLLGRKISLLRTVLDVVLQCMGAICGVGIIKGIMNHPYNSLGGRANQVAAGCSQGTALGAEIIGTFVLVYTVFSATDPKRRSWLLPRPGLHQSPHCISSTSVFPQTLRSCMRCRSWRHCRSGSRCSPSTWGRGSTRRGVSERRYCTTSARHGVIT